MAFRKLFGREPDSAIPKTPWRKYTKGKAKKLTPEKVLEIRELEGRHSMADVADMYNVSPDTIRGIWEGTTWKWL